MLTKQKSAMVLAGLKAALVKETPELSNDINWSEISKALIILLTGTDVHQSIRKTAVSHKTHIDLTDSDKTPAGINRVHDFFSFPKKEHIYNTELHVKNIQCFNPVFQSSAIWHPDQITFRRLAPRNNTLNPSAELTKKDDLAALRPKLQDGHYLVILHMTDDKYISLGTKKITWWNDTNYYVPNSSTNRNKRLYVFDNQSGLKNTQTIGNPSGKVSTGIQGISSDPIINKAVEDQAMKVVTDYLIQKSGKPIDVSTRQKALKVGLVPNPGYDILCRYSAGPELHVEVKGTQSKGETISLTENELKTASIDPEWKLAVVSQINITNHGNSKTIKATDGSLTFYKFSNTREIKNILAHITSINSTAGFKIDQTRIMVEIDQVDLEICGP